MFSKSNVATFVAQLEAGLDNVKENVKKDMAELQPQIEDDAKRMIPYDTGAATDSYYSRIVEEGTDIVLYAGFDEQGALSHYLPLIHELSPLEGDYGYRDFFVAKSEYRPDHDPQIKFLEKAVVQNWWTFRDKIKVSFK